MIRTINHRTRQEAEESGFKLLQQISEEEGLPLYDLLYTAHSIRFGKVADSFKEVGEKPVTPFDKPVTYGDEADELFMDCTNSKTGEKVGGRVYIYKNDLRDEPDYWAVALRPEEFNPANYTLPFRNLNERGLIVMARYRVRFFKPTRPLSFDEVRTPEGEEFLHKYFSEGEYNFPYWNYDFTPEQIKGGIDKGELFSPLPDPDIEDYPDEEDEDWLNNMVLCKPIAPSILSEATEIKIASSKDYLLAIQKAVTAPLDKRERLAARAQYNIHAKDLLLDYALYEFFRTESYDHLTEILSHFADFGLSENWYKGETRLTEYNSETKELEPISPVEYILSLYIREEISSMIGRGLSFKELSQATGTPLSVIYRASKLNVHEWI